MTDWDARFLDLATHISTWSKDRKRKVGAAIVGPRHEVRGVGYNGFAAGVLDDVEDRHVKPRKLLFVEHAERSTIYYAALIGVPLAGCTLYCTSCPCADCARAIILSGIKRVVAFKDEPGSGSWLEHWAAARTMFGEAGVELKEVARVSVSKES